MCCSVYANPNRKIIVNDIQKEYQYIITAHYTEFKNSTFILDLVPRSQTSNTPDPLYTEA